MLFGKFSIFVLGIPQIKKFGTGRVIRKNGKNIVHLAHDNLGKNIDLNYKHFIFYVCEKKIRNSWSQPNGELILTPSCFW